MNKTSQNDPNGTILDGFDYSNSCEREREKNQVPADWFNTFLAYLISVLQGPKNGL